jgi:pimeloyl-ACP methyl ester carboxylesterase
MPRPNRFTAWLARAAVRLFGLALAMAAAVWWAARPASPDAFYDPPLQRPTEPGRLLRHEAFSRAVPSAANAWRILYTTTRFDGTPTIASAIVMVAGDTAAQRPIIAWAHGTTGIERGCAPSLMSKPFANVPALPQILKEGWAYVATDYVGLGTAGGHAYLIGDEAARGVLDAVRAARQLTQLNLDSRTVVWGHSQGGGSALWTGMKAKDYAPELSVLGIGAFAPASDLKSLVASAKGTMFGKIVLSYLVHASAALNTSVNLDSLLRPGTAWLTRDIASRCAGEWPTLISALQTLLLPSDGFLAEAPSNGPLDALLDQNTPHGPFSMPVLLAQGETDDLVLPRIQQRYVEGLCRTMQPVTYKTYAGRDHIGLVAENSPLGLDAVAWTRDRFAGTPAITACGR